MDRATRILLAAVALICLAQHIASSISQLPETQFDDAFMFLRYAKNWLSGSGFSWNPHEGPAHGLTSVTHLFLVTALRGLTSLPDTVVLTSISFVSGLFAIAVLVLSGMIYFKRIAADWAPLLVVPYLILGVLFPYHSRTGMETTLSLFFNSVLVFAVLFLAQRRSLFALLLCLVVAHASFLTRPDMGLFALLLPPLFLTAVDKTKWRMSAAYVGMFSIILAADLLGRRALFGDHLPLSSHAKSAGFYRGYLGAYQWNVVHATFEFLRDGMPCFLVMVLCATRRVLPRLLAIAIPMLLTFAYLASVTQIMGVLARYYAPMLPFLVLGAFLAVNTWVEERRSSSHDESAARPRILAALLILMGLSSPHIEGKAARLWQNHIDNQTARYWPEQQFMIPADQELPQLDGWRSITEMDALLQLMPKNITLAASEYGYIGSRHLEIPIIDLVGLHDRLVARSGFSAESMLARQPDLIWMPHTHYSHLRKEILDRPEFLKRYAYLPGAYDHGLAVLKDAEHSTQILAIIQSEFSRVYDGRHIDEYWAEPLLPED